MAQIHEMHFILQEKFKLSRQSQHCSQIKFTEEKMPIIFTTKHVCFLVLAGSWSMRSYAVSELVDTATAVARGVAKGVLYFNARRRGDPALAVAANSDTALHRWNLKIC